MTIFLSEMWKVVDEVFESNGQNSVSIPERLTEMLINEWRGLYVYADYAGPIERTVTYYISNDKLALGEVVLYKSMYFERVRDDVFKCTARLRGDEPPCVIPFIETSFIACPADPDDWANRKLFGKPSLVECRYSGRRADQQLHVYGGTLFEYIDYLFKTPPNDAGDLCCSEEEDIIFDIGEEDDDELYD